MFNANRPQVPTFDEVLKMEGPPEHPGLMPPVVGTPDDILEQLRPLYEDGDTTHFSFFFRACGGAWPTSRPPRPSSSSPRSARRLCAPGG
jgi:hypothetical protein